MGTTLTQAQLTARRELYTQYTAIKTAISDLIVGRVSSINVSTGTGSKSFTKLSLAELRKEMTIIAQQIQAIDNSGRPAIRRIGFRTH
jgi:hypothetical protein